MCSRIIYYIIVITLIYAGIHARIHTCTRAARVEKWKSDGISRGYSYAFPLISDNNFAIRDESWPCEI